MSLVTPDSGLLFWMVIIFGVVFFILAKFGFPVITDMVRKRTESISQSLKLADEARAELAELNKEQARVLEDAAKVKASIIEQAKVQAQQEAEKVLAQARTEIAAEKESALRDIRKEVALLSMNITEKVLRTEFGSEEVRKQYVDKVMQELAGQKDSFMKN